MLHHTQDRANWSETQILRFDQFKPSKAFQKLKRVRLVDLTNGDLIVAMAFRFQRQIEWCDGVPKSLVIHGRQKRIELFNIRKLSHVLRIANPNPFKQISIRK